MYVGVGLDDLCTDSSHVVSGRSIGLIANQSAVTSAGEAALDALRRLSGVRICSLFAPEHGIDGVVADAEPVGDERHDASGLPVYSLFGERLAPTKGQLDDIDALVIDLQDIGSRFYTFATTMLYAMRAAAGAGVSVVVCDRPNPIGGIRTEGPVLQPELESFLGPGPLPIRHGMTMGELATLFNRVRNVDCDLTVIRCPGWSREMMYADTGLAWVPPSPGIPRWDTALPYPGTCLFEGTNLSEGRGTALPFETVGAPWLDADHVVRSIGQDGLPGVRLRSTRFVPCADRWAGAVCSGIQIHVIDRERFRPVRTGVTLIAAVAERHPDLFEWHLPHFDLLAGRYAVREAIESRSSIDELEASWSADLAHFEAERRSVLLY